MSSMQYKEYVSLIKVKVRNIGQLPVTHQELPFEQRTPIEVVCGITISRGSNCWIEPRCRCQSPSLSMQISSISLEIMLTMSQKKNVSLFLLPLSTNCVKSFQSSSDCSTNSAFKSWLDMKSLLITAYFSFLSTLNAHFSISLWLCFHKMLATVDYTEPHRALSCLSMIWHSVCHLWWTVQHWSQMHHSQSIYFQLHSLTNIYQGSFIQLSTYGMNPNTKQCLWIHLVISFVFLLLCGKLLHHIQQQGKVNSTDLALPEGEGVSLLYTQYNILSQGLE